ncbi:Cell adhesion molecule 2 like protein [Argiope bruennichi]|uniref:Cell adhesion molecule 2 like protein n=1 Tax=Argiope bruennichi TaxID=94029 RepID=A0A8T0E8Q1_ARGBR|nr:Cell adhesion molecule 2 like protein [Argiope bruennichi]
MIWGAIKNPGIDIDLTRTNSNIVFLRTVALDSAGNYKCQVSTDAPTYSCVQAVKEMNVIILPIEGPQITGGESTYELGDNITLNCTSAESKPAANLQWFINDQSVPDEETDDHGVFVKKDRLQISSKSLNLKLRKRLFRRGKLSLKCEASFYGTVATISKEITLLEIDSASACCCHCILLLISIILTFSSSIRYLEYFPS